MAAEAACHLSRKWVTVHGLTFERRRQSRRDHLPSAAYLSAGMAPELCSKTCVYDLPPDEEAD